MGSHWFNPMEVHLPQDGVPLVLTHRHITADSCWFSFRSSASVKKSAGRPSSSAERPGLRAGLTELCGDGQHGMAILVRLGGFLGCNSILRLPSQFPCWGNGGHLLKGALAWETKSARIRRPPRGVVACPARSACSSEVDGIHLCLSGDVCISRGRARECKPRETQTSHFTCSRRLPNQRGS